MCSESTNVGGQSADVLIFPTLEAANAAYKLVQRLAGAEAIGPILLGLSRSVHVMQRAASVKYVKDTITMVKELDGKEITIVPSTVGKIKPQGTPEDEWKWAVASLKQCYEHGQKEVAGTNVQDGTSFR